MLVAFRGSSGTTTFAGVVVPLILVLSAPYTQIDFKASNKPVDAFYIRAYMFTLWTPQPALHGLYRRCSRLLNFSIVDVVLWTLRLGACNFNLALLFSARMTTQHFH